MKWIFCFLFFFSFLTACQNEVASTEKTIKITTLHTGSEASFRGIASIGAEVVWLGGSKGTLLQSSDAGSTWQQQELPDSDSLDFRDIECLSTTSILVMSAGSGMNSRIYKTENNGKDWKTVLINTKEKAFFNGLDFWNMQSGILVSDAIDDKLYVLSTQNGGKTWQRIGEASLPKLKATEYGFAASGTGIVTANTDQIWIATGGDKARVFQSKDKGKSWTVRSTPMASGNASSGIFSISFRDSLNGIAVGGDYERPDATVVTLIRTVDGGKSWTAITGDNLLGHKACVQYLGDKAYLVVGRTGVLWSKDDGEHWEVLTKDPYYTIAYDTLSQVGYIAGPEGRAARVELVVH